MFNILSSGAGSAYPSVVGFLLLDFSLLCNVLFIVFCPLVRFLLAMVLSVFFRFTDSDYPFDIFKLFL